LIFVLQGLELGRKVGWKVVPGNNYLAQNDGDAIIFEGKGSGHGLGLCQQGASAMARDGATFRESWPTIFRTQR
jgi:stage II sporulation protein D